LEELMKRTIFVGALLLVAAAAVMAQVTAVYLEGTVEVLESNRWYDVFIGDSLNDTDTIRLGNGAYCELDDGTHTVRLTRSGSYDIGSLFASAGRTERAGLAGLVLNRVGRLTGTQEEDEQTSAGGARADAQEGPGIDWAGDETTDELVQQGVEALSQGDYDAALRKFEDALDAAFDDSEIAQSSFYLGYASYLLNNPVRALELLEEYQPDPDSDYFASHVLVLGQILLESFAFEDAIGYLEELVESTGGDFDESDVQSAQLMIGMAYRGLGMDAQARRYLRAAQRTLPGSPAADAAGRMLGEM